MRSLPAALIVVILVVPLFFTGLVAVGVSTWVLDRSFYATLLSDVRLYQIPDGLSSATRVRVSLPGAAQFSATISPRAVKEVLPPEHMRAQTLALLGGMFDFMEGKRNVFDPVLDLVPIKKALTGESGKRFARVVAEDLPVGPVNAAFPIGPGRLPDARPSGMAVERAAGLIAAGLPAFAKGIPDRIRMSDLPDSGGQLVRGGAWPGFSMLHGLVIADIIVLFIAAAFWVAAAFIGGTDARGRLQWLGWSLLVPAAVVFLFGFVVTVSFASDWMRSGEFAARLDAVGFTAGFISAAFNAVRSVMQRMGIGFLVTGAVAAGASMAFLGVSWSMPKERRSSP